MIALIIYSVLTLIFTLVLPPIGILMIIYFIYCLLPNSKGIGKTSIWIVMGKTGIGKTTYLALQSRKYIKKGYKVYSNVDILGTYKFNPKTDLGQYAMEDCLIIVDEAGLEFNSRDFKMFTKDLYKFFTMHRHARAHVILSVQFWDRLDIVIRELVHRIFVLQPCLFNKRLLKCIEIGNKIDINDDGVIVQRFHYIPILLSGYKYYYRKIAWDMFDTHSQDSLPKKEFELWGEYTPKKYKIININESKEYVKDFMKFLNKGA